MNLKKTATSVAITAALGGAALAPSIASATISTFNWDGVFTMLDGNGAGFANTSNTGKGANQYQTAVSGTMSFDQTTGAGTATLVPFDFFSGTLPAEAVGIEMQAIGDGMGDPNGTLVLGNMLFNWNGTYGIPVSIVLDAAGFFGATSNMWSDGVLDQGDVAGIGATPASDGTYTNATIGYLGLGPVPMATTEWDVTQAIACGAGDACLGVNPSGLLPLVLDTTSNINKYTYDDGWPDVDQGIGGIPMWAGPFAGNNANFDILSLTATGTTPGTIGPFPTGPEAVPVPAAVWLFGSGLLGLVGVARRKKQA